MPGPGLTDTSTPQRGVHITLQDYQGRNHSQFIPTNGGEVNNNADRDLAVAIAQASNAALYKRGKSDIHVYNIEEMDVYDEAEASVEKQIILVFQNKNAPFNTQEVVVPAYDASLLLPDRRTPDMTNALLTEVRDRALDVMNDDDNALSTGDYRFVRAFATTRKVGSRQRNASRRLPDITEPSPTASPPDDPAATPAS